MTLTQLLTVLIRGYTFQIFSQMEDMENVLNADSDIRFSHSGRLLFPLQQQITSSPPIIHTLLILLIDSTQLLIVEHQPTLSMGKTDRKKTQKRARKATSCNSKYKATDGESKHKKQPSFDATKFEATDDDDLRHSKWRDQFRQLCDFKVQFGHCLVPTGKYSANPKLGKWVITQRTASRLYPDGTPSHMPAERIRALNGIGFHWEVTNASWSERFEQLCEYRAQFGHCLVPNRYPANPELGGWVSIQRYNYKLQKEGKPSPMTAERSRALQIVGFD
jgi:hypothetical protein